MKRTLFLLVGVLMFGCAANRESKTKWVSLFNGKDLTGWTVHGKATWSVQDGVLVGVGGMGHI